MVCLIRSVTSLFLILFLQQSIQALLDLSLQMDLPVALCLDGNVWYGPQPQLWNWFDIDIVGYDPENVYNVVSMGVWLCW